MNSLTEIETKNIAKTKTKLKRENEKRKENKRDKM